MLQLIDVKMTYSTFSKSFEVHTGPRTLIVDHPETTETLRALLAHVNQNVPAAAAEMTDENIDLATITTVMTCQQIIDRINGEVEGNVGSSTIIINERSNQFTAVLYAVVTKYDLDGTAQIVLRRW